MTSRLGVDVGGSGVKCALVDTDVGKLLTEHFRIPTPQPASPAAVAATVAAVAAETNWANDRMGCTLPAVVTDDVLTGCVRIVPGVSRNNAGIIGAALAAEEAA